MELIYKLMKIQVLIVAVISSFILYGCEDNEADYLELSESSFGNVSGDGATLTVNDRNHSSGRIYPHRTASL